MADRYWVGGAGTWDGSATTHWASSSGGSSGASAPTSSDTVTFDTGSGLGSGGTVTVSATAACGGMTVSGINTKTLVFSLTGNPTWSAGTYTFQGNSDSTPILFQSSQVGVTRTLTINGTHGTHSDVHFQDIALTGTIGTLTGTRIGDCLGNTGITFTPAVTQHFTNTGGGSWSTAANWTTAVPLPQDTVIVDTAFLASKTVTIDMPRIGADVTFAGCSGSPTLAASANWTCYGSFTLDAALGTSLQGNVSATFGGRGTHTITCAGKTWGGTSFVAVSAPGGTYTLADALNIGTSKSLQVIAGILNGNGKNVTATVCTTSGGLTRAIQFGSNATWTLNGTGNVFTAGSAGGLTVTFGAGTIIDITDTSATAKTFVGNSLSYPTLRHKAAGAAALTITGSNTFAGLDLECGTARTVTLPAGGTQTVTGTVTLTGASGQLLSLVSATPGTTSKLTITGAAVPAPGYVSFTDLNCNSNTGIDARTNCTDGGNNHNVLFASPKRFALAGVGP